MTPLFVVTMARMENGEYRAVAKINKVAGEKIATGASMIQAMNNLFAEISSYFPGQVPVNEPIEP